MLKKTKISKVKPNDDLINRWYKIKETQKNNSKISVIKERLKKNIGEIVYVLTASPALTIRTIDNLVINFKGKLTNNRSNEFFEVESENEDFIDFTLKNISSVSEHQKLIPGKKQIYIYLKL